MEIGGPSKAALLYALKGEDSGAKASGGVGVGIAPVGSERLRLAPGASIENLSRLTASLVVTGWIIAGVSGG
jgi:hypothetical protein